MAKGLEGASTTLKRPAGAGQGGLVAAMRARSNQIEVVPAELANNPRNPAGRLDPEGLQGLVASILEVGGVLMPIVVASAEAFLELHPADAEVIGEAKWVALAGHRRRAAHALALTMWAQATVEARAENGWTEPAAALPAVVRDDLGARMDEITLHENLHRLELTPTEEATEYQRLVESGYSQRDIARRLGVSQGHVSKRLSLLKLPATALSLLDTGAVDIQTALGWTEQPVEVLDEFEKHQGKSSPMEAMRRARESVVAKATVARAKSEAEAQGARYIDDPHKALGSSYYNAELRNKRDIETAAKAGTLLVAAGHSYNASVEGADPRYFDSAKKAPRATISEDERAARKARKEADKNRGEFLAGLAAKKPTAAILRDALVRAVVDDININGHETDECAMTLAKHAGVGPDTTEYWSWRAAVATDANADHLAWIIILSGYEAATKPSFARWDTHKVRAYYALLQQHGYQPSPWELSQLKAKKGSNR